MATSDHIRDANASVRRESKDTLERFARRLYDKQRIINGESVACDLPSWEELSPEVKSRWISQAKQRSEAQLADHDS